MTQKITTNSAEEYFALCRRIEAGEFVMQSIDVGKTNGEWIFTLREPTPTQPMLLNTTYERGRTTEPEPTTTAKAAEP